VKKSHPSPDVIHLRRTDRLNESRLHQQITNSLQELHVGISDAIRRRTTETKDEIIGELERQTDEVQRRS